ncbi:hypothetical protein [Emcibacter sp.]|uniref:hypothetical protein n=1 Tax=Emcibacter sp. TaxID=1979954 RepID=UPI003A92F49C
MVSYHSYLKYVFVTYMATLVVMSPMALVRLTGLFNAAVFVRIILPLLFVGAMIFLWHKVRGRLKVDGFAWFLFSLCFYGFFWGFFRSNDLYVIVADTASILIALAIYIVSQQRVVYPLKLETYFNFFAYAMLIGDSITVLIGYILRYSGFPIYMSFGNVMALFPFVWFLATKNYKWAAVVFFVIVLSGKVGVMMAVPVIVLAHILLAYKKSLGSLVVYGILLLVGINVLLFAIKDIKFTESGVFGAALVKIQYQNPYRITIEDIQFQGDDSDNNAQEYGGGRVGEVIYSLKALSEMNYKPFLTGGGHGFVYDFYEPGRVLKDIHNVHLSPISLTVKYGVILTVFYYLGVLFLFGRYYKFLLVYDKNPMPFAMLYFCVGNFIFSFTAYSIFVVGVFWFFLGFLRNIASTENTIKIRVAEINPGMENSLART